MRILQSKSPFIKPSMKDLLDHPVVIRVGEIKDDTAKHFSEQFNAAHNTGQEVIPIIIDSPGGRVYTLLAMLAEIEQTNLPVVTVCVGKAMSAASILLASGTPGYRFIDASATVMIHEVSAGTWGKLEDMKNSLAESERLNKLIFKKLAKSCGHKNEDYFLQILDKKKNKDWFLTAPQAKQQGLVDAIGLPTYSMSVEVKHSFLMPGK